jgi:hypothetical protein
MGCVGIRVSVSDPYSIGQRLRIWNPDPRVRKVEEKNFNVKNFHVCCTECNFKFSTWLFMTKNKFFLVFKQLWRSWYGLWLLGASTYYLSFSDLPIQDKKHGFSWPTRKLCLSWPTYQWEKMPFLPSYLQKYTHRSQTRVRPLTSWNWLYPCTSFFTMSTVPTKIWHIKLYVRFFPYITYN